MHLKVELLSQIDFEASLLHSSQTPIFGKTTQQLPTFAIIFFTVVVRYWNARDKYSMFCKIAIFLLVVFRYLLRFYQSFLDVLYYVLK